MSAAGTDVLLLVAHRLELSGFAGALGPEPIGSRAELHGLTVAVAEVGVGMPAAGAGAARALERVRPRATVLLGSFGAYPGPEALAIGRLLVPERVIAADGACIQELAAMPAAMPQRAECDPALAGGLALVAPGCARGALATTLAITIDDGLARALGAASGSGCENLEALAVALACEHAAVPFAALLACTNEVGSKGRAQWAAHHADASRATAAGFMAWLAAGAPGANR